MSTTSLTAGEVMRRVASLMNDTARTNYTYAAQLPYLNMAIDDLMEQLEESNASPSNQTSALITLPIGSYRIGSTDSGIIPSYPSDLVEIQEIGERTYGTTDQFVKMSRREFLSRKDVASNVLGEWIWEDQIIKFQPVGALSIREIELKYVREPIALAADENSVIGTISARPYLSFKTAAYCAFYIGENESRAGVLDVKAEQSIERLLNINSKGRQEMITRRRPFRASYKSKGFI